MKQQQSIIFVSFLLCIPLASAQLTYHLDANTNSYTLQTPNSQQTFTQHFNTRNGVAQQQQQQQVNQIQPESSQPQQLFSTSPQQFANNQNNGQEDINNYLRQQFELQQLQRLNEQQQQQQQQQEIQQLQRQQQQQQQQNNLYQFEQRKGVQKIYSPQDVYSQQVQQAQLLQQQQQQQQLQYQGTQLPYAYRQSQQASLSDSSANQGDELSLGQSQNIKYQQSLAAPSRIQFSPSNEVSHVKFSSGDLSYNF